MPRAGSMPRNGEENLEKIEGRVWVFPSFSPWASKVAILRTWL